MPAAPAAPAAPDAATMPLVPVTSDGNRREFLRIVVRGAFLQLITFGFYRFWLSTHIRRHLWSNTSAEGDAAEYTGTPLELLVGFLFAIAILVPVYILYFAIGVWVEVYQTFASIPLVLFLYLFIQFAIYRARRYRLSRTIWRGVRFWMRGSGWDYAWRAVLSTVPVALTLGLLLPWRTAMLERFKMKNSYYGSLQGSFEGTGLALLKSVWVLWAALLSVMLFLYLAPKAAPFTVLLLVIGAPFLYAIYKAIEWQWWVSGIRFGSVIFHSDLPATALISRYWSVLLWSILFLLILGICIAAVVVLAGGVATFGTARIGSTFKQFWPLPVMAILYIVTLLAIGVVRQLYLTRDIWQRVAESTFIMNLSSANDVIAQGDAANAVGEGFADGFDVGGL
jgi:uncharacterized membrane protein YjgN (DUF898 family)